MKPHLRNLRRGQEVWALIEEAIASEELIINYNGDLVRVSNETGRQFRVGQRVLLQVENLSPLRLKLLVRKTRQPASLDVTI